MTQFHVAIDGPAGSGKSSISKMVAKRLNYVHIDTGAMYRAVTWYALSHNLNLELESSYNFLENIAIRYKDDSIFVNDTDVSNFIRSEEVTKNVSLVSSFKYVRDKMVHLQRQAVIGLKAVIDGRDIGTVVLPNANLKIYLTAAIEERAKRRYKELLDKGIDETLDFVLEDIKKRDYKDSNRKESPLKKADDANLLDTTYLTIDEVVNEIILMIKRESVNND